VKTSLPSGNHLSFSATALGNGRERSRDALSENHELQAVGHAVQKRIPGYVPYAYKYDLYSDPWKGYGPIFEKQWLPISRGERASIPPFVTS